MKYGIIAGIGTHASNYYKNNLPKDFICFDINTKNFLNKSEKLRLEEFHNSVKFFKDNKVYKIVVPCVSYFNVIKKIMEENNIQVINNIWRILDNLKENNNDIIICHSRIKSLIKNLYSNCVYDDIDNNIIDYVIEMISCNNYDINDDLNYILNKYKNCIFACTDLVNIKGIDNLKTVSYFDVKYTIDFLNKHI